MIFLLLYIIDVIVTIYAENCELRMIQYGSKILLMPLLAMFLYSQTKNISKFKLIYLALFFSWLGDILLMFPRNEQNLSTSKLLFVFGLISFLIAHINYSIYFINEVKDDTKVTLLVGKPYLILPFCAYGIILLSILYPSLASMKLPVTCYTIIIMLMVMAAFNRKNIINSTSFLLVFIGAIIFVCSDSCIAINVFYKPFNFARIAIMSTYTIAQFLIIYGVIKANEKIA